MKNGISFSTLNIWCYRNIETLQGQKDNALQILFAVDFLISKFTWLVSHLQMLTTSYTK